MIHCVLHMITVVSYCHICQQYYHTTALIYACMIIYNIDVSLLMALINGMSIVIQEDIRSPVPNPQRYYDP